MFSDCVSGDDSDSPGKSTAVEGKIKLTSEVLEGLGFSQVVSCAITFSFVYHNRHKDKGSLIPTIQVSRDGFDVFFYDCKNDVLIGQMFDWSHVSLIFLWAILNYRLFPPKLSQNCLQHKFGYEKTSTSGTGFLCLGEGEFYFAENIDSYPFLQSPPPSERLHWFQN